MKTFCLSSMSGLMSRMVISNRLKRSSLLLLVLITLWCAFVLKAVASSAHPNVARGSGAGTITSSSEWDNINVFNGNLNIPIRLGGSYPLSPTFDYQFALHYNSNLWEVSQTSSTVSTALLNKLANAGAGWDLSFGRLIDPFAGDNPLRRWVYVSADGSAHPLYETLHENVAEPQDNTFYTRDNTYHRLRQSSATTCTVESPDGKISTFELINQKWELTKIADRFNNYLSISYATPNAWALTDNHGRRHIIYFRAYPTQGSPLVIDRIELAAFGAGTATYTFTYATGTISRPSIDNDPATSATVTAPLLTGVTAPDGSKHSFTYHPSGAANDSSGRIAAMTLPTMGKLEWTYQTYLFAGGSYATSLSPAHRKNTGVATRRLVEANGEDLGSWTFTQSLHPGGGQDREMRNTVRTPLGDKTVYYFSINTQAGGTGWHISDYALPLTKNEADRPPQPVINVALASNGARATASSTINSRFPASAVLNGERRGVPWGDGGGWNDATSGVYPDWVQVEFSETRTINEIDVFTAQTNLYSPAEPTESLTFSDNGITAFDVQYWDGSAWLTVPGGRVTGNNRVWRKFIFPEIATSKIRVVVNAALNLYSRVVEVEAYQAPVASDTRYLSRQYYDCDSAGNNCQLLRSLYARYEQDAPTDPAQPDAGNTNRRGASQRIIYHDDVEGGVARFADTNKSEFDGLGNYRWTRNDGNFGAGDRRDTFVNYNSSAGTYPSAFTMPAADEAWVLNTYSQSKIFEGQSSQVREFCFNRATGFLERLRRLKSSNLSATAGGNDVIVVYTPNAAGQVAKEQYYGGDVQAVGTASLCSLSLPADQYQIRHAYQYGTLSSSQHYGSAGSPFGPKLLDQDVDRNTGLPSAGRDTAGLATQYSYDLMGRLMSARPASGHGAWKLLTYTTATQTEGAKKFVYQTTEGGASILTYNAEVYDGFGRIDWEQTLMPDGSYPTRDTSHNAMGWLTRQSQYSLEAPRHTLYLNYDPFGRYQTVRPPDGAHHDITYQYVGVRAVRRAAQAGAYYNPVSGQVVETADAATEIYDRQGRLWKEIAHPRESYTTQRQDSVTVHEYNIAGNWLRSTRDGAPTGSSYSYDGRGFLFLVQGRLQSTSYQQFDALGNSRLQRPHQTDLAYNYDRAGRLVNVVEANDPTKVWKEFFYATSNATNDWRAGKLWKTKRYNSWSYAAGGGLVVTETFTYGGSGGRVSRSELQLSDAATTFNKFSQSYAYTDLGGLAQINYPSSLMGPGLGRSRSVNNTYTRGLLTGIAGTRDSAGESWVDFIGYHPHGLLSQIRHSNGVTDHEAKDPNGLPRIYSLNTTGVKPGPQQRDDNFYSGDFQYDGNGKMVRIGSRFFVPQEGTQPPAYTPASGSWDSACESADPFGTHYLLVKEPDCAVSFQYLFNADDRVVKLINFDDNKTTWSFYDTSGRLVTEYVLTNAGVWLSTRDTIYLGHQPVAEVESTPTGTRTVHFHSGRGVPGILTDANGARVNE